MRTFCLLISLTILTTALKAAEEATYALFTSPDDSYSISYPKEWNLSKNTKGFTLLLKSPRYGKLDFFQENISLTIKNIDSKILLIDCAEESLEILDGTFNNFKVLENTVTSFKNLPAYSITYEGSIAVYNARRDFKLWQLFVQKEQKLYILTYTGEKSTWDFFKKSAASTFNSLSIK